MKPLWRRFLSSILRTYALDISDADDEWVVASVVSCGADVFVTGDRQLLDGVGDVEGIRFLSPRDFWEMLAE